MSKIRDIDSYATIVFDCDGVLLNSNQVKTQAFYDTALAFGEHAAERLVRYHIERGGISRYEKFQWFIDNLQADDIAHSTEVPILDMLLARYAEKVYKGLRSCRVAAGLSELRERTKDSRWLIVSGGDQSELRELFSERKMAHFFDGGIFGSPDTKEAILTREKEMGEIVDPAVFIGDSQYDYTASQCLESLDFIFVSQWSEVKNWQKFCHDNDIVHRASLEDLL